MPIWPRPSSTSSVSLTGRFAQACLAASSTKASVKSVRAPENGIGRSKSRSSRGSGSRREAIAPRHGRQIERDPRAPRGHRIVIGGAERLAQLAIGAPLGKAHQLDRGRIIRQDRDGETPPRRAADLDHAGAHRLEIALARGLALGDLRQGGGARHGFGERHRARRPIEAERHPGALGHGQLIAFQPVQIKAGLGGIARRFGPAFPARAHRGLGRARGAGHGAGVEHPRRRPENQRHDKRDQRRDPQRERVAPRQIGIGRNRTRARRALGHPRQMRGPKRPRRRIIAAQRHLIAERRQGPPGQRRIEPCDRLGPRRPAEPPQPKDKSSQLYKAIDPRQRQMPCPRHKVLHPEGQRRKTQRHYAQEWPEGAQPPFQHHPRPRQRKRGAASIASGSVWVGRISGIGPFRRAPAGRVAAPNGLSRSEPFRDAIAAEHFLKARSLTNDGEVIPLHQHLGDQRARIVFRGHHRAICPRRAEGDQIAGGRPASDRAPWRRCRRSRRPGPRCRTARARCRARARSPG